MPIFVRVSLLGHSYSVENLMDSENHLLAYVRSGDEAAFAKVVAAYSSLVYGTAYRKTRNVQLAEEVTQNVFVLLARKAEKLVSRPSLGGWLHRTALLASQNLLRSEAAHRRRTELFKEKGDLSSGQDIEIFFEGVDEALNKLSESDRTVVMMRFFEEKEFREIGAKVGKSPDAVQKQIRRALDKLNRTLTAKGATFSLATIGLVLSSELAKAAPVASSAMISAKAVSATSSIPIAGHLVTNFLHTMSTLKTSTVVGTILLVAAIPAVVQHSQAREIRKELAELNVGQKNSRMARSTSLRKPSTRSPQTPVKRMLASSKRSLTGEELLEEMQQAMMSQNTSQMMQLFLPLGLMSEGELKILLAEVESAEVNAQLKGMVASMLMEMIPSTEEGRGSRLARKIANNEYVGNFSSEMWNWVKEDVEEALLWFQESQANGALFGKGVDSAEPELGAIIAERLAKNDVNRALALADSVEPSGRAVVLAGIARALAEKGGEGLTPLIDPVKTLNDIDSLNLVVGEAVTTLANRGKRDEVLPFLESLGVEPRVLNRAMGVAVAAWNSKDSVPQRMEWLFETVGETNSQAVMKEAISSLYLNEAEATREWIDGLTVGEVRDLALVSETSAMMNGGERKEAFDRLSLISDQAVREEQQNNLIEQWQRWDPLLEMPEGLLESE